eukprot:640201-Amphidinium_carterae.1
MMKSTAGGVQRNSAGQNLAISDSAHKQCHEHNPHSALLREFVLQIACIRHCLIEAATLWREASSDASTSVSVE